MGTFGLTYDQELVMSKIRTKSVPELWAGSLYKYRVPDVPMAFPPLEWQTYDIEFTAPRFNGKRKMSNAKITMKWNGIKVYDKVEIAQSTRKSGVETPDGIVYFQAHLNPVAYRNIWIAST